jgi:hypothetical protein
MWPGSLDVTAPMIPQLTLAPSLNYIKIIALIARLFSSLFAGNQHSKSIILLINVFLLPCKIATINM